MTGQEEAPRAHEYELGHSDREIKRLQLQAQLVDPFTREFFQKAGLTTGMKVLEIGCGAGDTSLLVLEIVGDSGKVVGIDTAATAVTVANSRMERLGKSNARFHQADPMTFEPGETFDALVGRYVLMFNPEPERILKSLLRHVRPGGVVAFHEVDWVGSRSNPNAPLFERCTDLIVQTFQKVGTNPHMAQSLHSVFRRAGAGLPTMALRAAIEGPSGSENYVDLLAELTITMLPVMEDHGLVQGGSIDPASLARRMREEVERLDGVVVGRSEVGAWTRLP